MGLKRLVLGSVLALAATFAVAAPAGAAEVDYPTGGPDVRDFSDSAGGWVPQSRYEGGLSPLLCLLQPITCPSIDMGFEGSGGAEGPGDGFLSTHISGVAGVTTTAIASWRSPGFQYAGVPDVPTDNDTTDDAPDRLFFTFDRLTRAGSLVDVLQNGHIDVYIDRVGTAPNPQTPPPIQSSIKIVDRLEIEDQDQWTSLPAVEINPSQLTLGQRYSIRIEAVFSMPVASVLPDAFIGYDNVLLRAIRTLPGEQDTDGDGVPDEDDNCIFIPNGDNPGEDNQADTDGDGIGDACDATPTGPEDDIDNDGVLNEDDNCIFIPNGDNPGQDNQADNDNDGIGNACDPTPDGPDLDLDDDGVNNDVDNCPTIKNGNNPGEDNQADADEDGVGDACDPTPTGPDTDLDNDTINDDDDNCPTVPNTDQADADGDEVGDVCDPTPTGPDTDLDDDTIPNNQDNCIFIPNTNQADADNDGVGDVCDPTPNGPPGPGGGGNDPDGDGVPTPQDNCPLISNPSQTDSDGDGVGDACDPTPFGPDGQVGNPRGGEAFFDGRRLFIRLQCFGVAKKGQCVSRATAFKTRGGTRYTFPIQRIVPAKTGKVIRARVRFQFREELERRNSIVLKSVLREDRKDRTKTTKYKTLKLIDRTQED